MNARAHAARLAIVAVSWSLVVAGACSGPSGPIDGDRAMAHVRTMVGFGARPFGSDALAKTADYITSELTTLSLKPQRHEVVHDKEQKTIRNLYVQIDGDDPANGPILMIGAHYDTKLTSGHADAAHNIPFVGAIDGGGGPAVLLELARALHAGVVDTRCNVWLYWIDAEESIDWTWNDERALLGSKAFVKMLADTKVLPRVKAFVLIDLIGSKAFKIDRDGNSNSKLQEIFQRAATELGEPGRLYEFPSAADIDEARRRGVSWGITDDHNTFTRYGVPSVLLIDIARRNPAEAPDPRFEQWWHTPADDLDAMDEDALAFTGNLLVQALPQLDAFVTARK